MTAVQLHIILFVLSLSILAYTYFGYGLIIALWTRINRKKKPAAQNFEAPLTLVIAAYNEEDCLEEKIKNSLSLRYPAHLISYIIITDGSTDRSPEIVQKFPQIRLMHQKERRGKTDALNRAMQEVTTAFVVFTDANTLLNEDCLALLMRHYKDEKVGGVAGEKKVGQPGTLRSAVETGEGYYWKYESALKKLDAQFYTVVGAAGELFSIRTSLFKALPTDTITDDFMISIGVCLQGYTMAYEPLAFATELPSASIGEEAKRKTRISAGGFQSIARLKKLLNPFFNFRLFFQYLSRRVFRLVLCPISLIICFISNAWLLAIPKIFFHPKFCGAVFLLPDGFVWLAYCE